MTEACLTAPTATVKAQDYALNASNSARAIRQGLAEAEWYQSPVPRATMRALLERRNGPALRDTALWFALIGGFAYATIALWGSWWAILPYLCYAALYASTSDSRWHESSHGTAFKSDWLNNALYEIASFMVMRESTVWRWSHNRHHSDTIILGRDPEIAVPRPPKLRNVFLSTLNIPAYKAYFTKVLYHACGRLLPDEQTYIPAAATATIFFKARIYLLIYLCVIAWSVVSLSFLPVLMVGGVNLFGTWLMLVYGLTQHAALAENVLDHRLNCRTMYLGRINAFLYWNMQYHIEHHMYPLVPYHALPKLHAAIKDDCPPPYPSLWAAWKEIIPAILRQRKDPSWFVQRPLPAVKTATPSHNPSPSATPNAEGWVVVGHADMLASGELARFDCGQKTFALMRKHDGSLHATDGMCTHGNTHLAEGLLHSDTLECPKHNGRFRIDDGAPARTPICRGLATYPLEEREGQLWLNVQRAGGHGARTHTTYELEVVANTPVATFITELVLRPKQGQPALRYTPGDYLQIEIPTFTAIRLGDVALPEPYAATWRAQNLLDLVATNTQSGRRNNYSLASNPHTEPELLRFNVRLATPPPGQSCPPGVGSAYVWSLKPGDTVRAIGPFGDFHPKPTQREMVYIGGGAGMAPLRAHISWLLESEGSPRRISFWYGARSRQELFYTDYFEQLARQHENFQFHLALSAPNDSDAWQGHTGFIHQVVFAQYLKQHPNPTAVEYYLCGPPPMIQACSDMLRSLGVSEQHIAFDAF